MVQVVIPCCEADQDQAERLIRWIAELGQVNTKGHLHCSKDCKVDYLMALMQEAFVETKWIQDVENIKSNWREPGHHHKSAAGPNSLFRQVAWYFNLRDRRPWLFLEPDAIPCRKDWYEKLDQEYREGKKPFLGAKVLSTVPGSDIPTHMTGVAIYHPDTPAVSNMAVVHNETPFDITGAADFMPQAKFTTSIVHHFRRGDFVSQEDFESRVPQGTCLYHTCKTGSIIPYLRARLGMRNAEEKNGAVSASSTHLEFRPSERLLASARETLFPNGIVPGTPSCDIFIKTWDRDWPWLEWCLKSIKKFAKGFRKVVVVSEKKPPFEGFEWVQRNDFSPGYLDQQAAKLRADLATDAEFILFTDSDCVFTREITPRDFIENGKTKWRVTPFGSARDDQSVWIGPMEKFVGKRPTHECMREHPHFVPRWALEEVHKFCEYRHGMPIWEYVMGQATDNPLALVFSEWNCLGWFLFTHHHEKFIWVEDKDATPCTWQGHTHSGDERMHSDLAKMREIVEGAPTTLPEPEKPVASLTEQLRGHVEALKALIEPSKVGRTQMLHEELRRAGLLGPAQKRKKKDSLLLMIHTYPKGNDTLSRHWNGFASAGADKVVIVTTEDDESFVAGEGDQRAVIKIGANKYIDGDHLVQRLIETIEYALTTEYTHFCICEYDVVFLDKIPKFSGCCAHSTGGQLPGSKASKFHHNPWLLDRETAEKLLPVMKELAPTCTELPDNSPDVFFGYATEKAGIEVKEIMKQFTRNTIEPHDIGDMMKAVQDGVQVIHGIKDQSTFDAAISNVSTREVVSVA